MSAVKPVKEDRIQVVRTLTYVGPRSWVEKTLSIGYIKDKRDFSGPNGDGRFITSEVGPEVIVKVAEEQSGT